MSVSALVIPAKVKLIGPIGVSQSIPIPNELLILLLSLMDLS